MKGAAHRRVRAARRPDATVARMYLHVLNTSSTQPVKAPLAVAAMRVVDGRVHVTAPLSHTYAPDRR
jgi:hypothetical protein